MINYLAFLGIVFYITKQYIRNYNKGLLASLFFLILCPLNIVIEISVLMPSLTIHRMIQLITIFFWLNNKDIPKKIRNIPFATILLVTALLFALSILVSPLKIVSLKRYLYFLFETVIFFIILQTSLKNEDYVIKVIKTVAFSLLVVCLIGIVERYTGFNPTNYLGAKYSYEFNQLAGGSSSSVKRDVISTYLHRILFGLAAAVGVIHFLFLTHSSSKKSQNNIYWFSFLISGAALYFSFSRGPWIALIISVLFTTILSPAFFSKKLIFIFIVVFAVFMIRPGTRYTILSLVNSTIDSSTVKGSSYRWRFTLYEVAYDKIIGSESPQNLLLGFGQASHVFLDFGRYELSTGHVVELESWDSEFAVILLENGFIGFLLTIYFYIYVIFLGIRCYFQRKINKKIVLLSMASIIIFVFMKSNVKIYAPQLSYLEFTSISILSAMIAFKETPQNRTISTEGVKNP